MVTAKDVAKRAGVSQATVSYVMSGSRPISEATKKRVREAMDELGYVPNINARSLAGGKVGVIGVLVRMDENTDLAELRPFLVVIMEEARKRGSSVMLVPADEGIEGLRRMARQGLVDGVLVFDIEWHDDRLEGIADLKIPVVLIGTTENSYGLPCIDVDYRRVAQLAVNRLVEEGAHKIAVIGDWGRSSDRFAFSKLFGSEARVVAQVLGVGFELFIPPERGWRGIWAVKDILLDIAKCHGGVAVRTPHALQSLLELCVELGIRPGKDFYLVAVYVDGFEDTLRIPVDNIDPVPDLVSRQAVAMLFDQIDGQVVTGSRFVAPRITVRS
ncbi:LacI family DNA-binding transcriptional regulator [Bifidobacterium felsineum]|uniref:LacI family transcriptional regulator n=1 Tax=Bifidobacterium felsineum TaxID=2045440 RepID=A0A2M9HIP6_9BIFI|nr:LacI family DNA-binding transcriptional regulator [Bifidobacterium felsineum]PJM76682.1 LacI family transcriptional regulator [Bifidobacterium felsineum]